jgi:hypothetical protein
MVAVIVGDVLFRYEYDVPNGTKLSIFGRLRG